MKDTIVLGLDVCHGRTQDPENYPSVVALCAATNEHFTKYVTALRIQSARQEIVQDLASMIQEVMVEYMKQNRKPPKNVLFYRDGVGEGMYERIDVEEVLPLRQEFYAIAQQYKCEAPRMTYVIVQKRHHFRAYAESAPKGNPYPGTLVEDKNVIDVGKPNFYLYSHKALAGTARPTHYQIRDNDLTLSVQQVAEFTYALAHLHQGCTKAVSLPAPVYYADRAAGIASACFCGKVDKLHNSIKNTLFMI